MKLFLKSTSIAVIAICLLAPQIIYANMAAPSRPDLGSSITFEKNDEISVLSEVLDIRIDGAQADIVATYKMKNTTDKSISTQSMFLSPGIENSGVAVSVNDRTTDYAVARYSLNYSTEIGVEDWQYAVLVDEDVASPRADKTVDTITFQMDFAPNEDYDVVVAYRYQLGGYPDSDFDAKRGEIEYYLAPAAMWKDFSSLTINLYLDSDMPIIKSSSLEFEKVDTRTYQYTAQTLPQENLTVVVDEGWWQNICSTLRSPYLWMVGKIVLPIILISLAVIIFFVWRAHQKKKAA